MKLSVITINYNNRDGLEKTIKSVINQTSKDMEYIIIDGSSTDGSIDVIKRYNDQINYWVSEPDKGIYNAMNKGVNKASGDYCIFMNSGDCFADEVVVEDVLKIGLKTDIVTGGIVFGPNNTFYGPKSVTLRHFFKKSLAHQASFIRTSVLREIPYDETLRIVSDWKFFIEAIVINKHSYSPIDRLIGINEPAGRGSNRALSDYEHNLVLHSILPDCAFEDYDVLLNGSSDYDRFYRCISNSRFTKLIYIINCALMKLFTFWQKDSWTKQFKLFPNNFHSEFKKS